MGVEDTRAESLPGSLFLWPIFCRSLESYLLDTQFLVRCIRIWP